jgi:hypothetical protein
LVAAVPSGLWIAPPLYQLKKKYCLKNFSIQFTENLIEILRLKVHVRQSKRKIPGRHRHGWNNYIKMDVKEIG